MKKYFYIATLITLTTWTLASCNSDNLLQPNLDEPEKTANSENPYLVSESDALKIAEESFSDFYPETRGVRNHQSIEKITNRLQTRSQESNGWYIINYENNSGFAVVSSDKRMMPILAISNKGHLEMSDTMQNRPLALFFRMAEVSLLNIDSEIDDQNETSLGVTFPGGGTIIGDSLKPEPKPDPTPNPKKETICKIDALIKAPMTTWHQHAPYNAYCPLNDEGKRTLVGCNALAGGQIMAYHEYPSRFNWTEIKAGNKDLTAQLLATLGGPDYMNSSYGVVATSANANKARNGLSKMGYTVSTNRDFTSNAYTDLRNIGPLFMSSQVTFWDYVYKQETHSYYYKKRVGGHAWVIDGCNIYRLENVGQGMVIYPGYVGEEWFYYYYYHCLWGHGGSNDGYYYWSDSSAALYKETYPYGRQPSMEFISYFTVKPNK